MQLDNLHSLFLHELRDLYDAEQQIIDAMPKMIEMAQSDELKSSFETHLEETKEQHQKLQSIFTEMNMDPSGKHCAGMEGLLEEATELMTNIRPSWTLDAGLIGAAQRVEHYEIAGYGTAAAYAKQLGLQKALVTLLEILEEEKATDEKLTKLAEVMINQHADKPQSAPQAL